MIKLLVLILATSATLAGACGGHGNSPKGFSKVAPPLIINSPSDNAIKLDEGAFARKGTNQEETRSNNLHAIINKASAPETHSQLKFEPKT